MYLYKATILRVVDGDTVDALVDLGFHITIEMKLRLYGINAPEMKTEAGHPARDYLKSLLDGKIITLKTIKDKREKYGRYLAILIADNAIVNDMMVNAGHAVPYTP